MDALSLKEFIIKTVVHPLLLGGGGVRKGNSYHFKSEYDVRIIVLSSDRWNNKERAQIGFDIGFYNERLFSLLVPDKANSKPSFVDCLIYFRLGNLLEPSHNYFYQFQIDKDQETEQLIDSIKKGLNMLLYLFSRLKKPKDYLELLDISEKQSQMIRMYYMELAVTNIEIEEARIVFYDLYENFVGHESVKNNLWKFGLQNNLTESRGTK